MQGLPYDPTGSLDDVDVASVSFSEYTEKHGQSRFGMGLLIAKRGCPNFRLSFTDSEGKETPWRGEGSVRGTAVTFDFSLASDEQDRKEGNSYGERHGQG